MGVNKWNSSRNPPKSMREVIITNGRYVALGHYNSYKEEWFEHEGYDSIKVTHWMEKPLPPQNKRKK